MRKLINFFALAALMFMPALASAQSDSCAMTINGHDSYSGADGWNGNTLTVFQNGVQIQSFTVPSGSTDDSLTFNVGSDAPVSFVYTLGSGYSTYPSENTFTIKNGFGEVVYTSPTCNLLTSGDTCFTATVPCPSCAAPTGLTTTNPTNEGITLSWTAGGEETSWIVKLNGEEIAASPVSDTFYVFTGLDANTIYTVEVLTACDDGNTSSAATGTFKTLCQNGNCEISITGVSPYYGYAEVWQNGGMIASVTSNGSVDICNGDSLIVLFQAGSYSSGSTITVRDAADTKLADAWARSAHSSDTIIAMANGCPSCMPVTGLAVSGEPTTDEITVTWNASMGDIEGYIIYLNGEIVDGPITDNTYTFSGLNPSTGYTISVQVACDEEDNSALRTITVATACGIIHIDEDHPFFEDFDAYAEDVMPNCWEYDPVAQTHWDGGLFFKQNAHTGGNVLLPEFDAPINTLMISFKGKLTPCDGIIVGVLDTVADSVTWLDTLQVPGQSQADFLWGYEHSFADYDGEGTRIALRSLNTGSCPGVAGPWSLIDDISVTVVPDCMMPTLLTAHNLNNEDSSYFTWHNAAGCEYFEVVWDTVTASINDIYSNAQLITDTTFVIEDGSITRGGKYVFYVRSICGGADGASQWRQLEFACGEVMMPATNGTIDTIVGCGFVVYDNGGPNSAYASNTTSTLVLRPTLNDDRMAITAGWFRLYQTTVYVYDGIGTNGDLLYQYYGANEIYSFSDTLITGELGPMTVYFPAGNLQASGFELYITCIPGVSCKKPIDVTATDITAEGATISWHNGNATNEEVGGVYRIWYREEGDTVWNFVDADDSTYTFEGTLTPNTAYEMYVRGICADDDSSNVVDPIHFRTACPGESCQVNVNFSGYYTSNYELSQNGSSYGVSSSNATYNVCAGQPLTLRTTTPSYSYGGVMTVTNIADIELFRMDVDSLTNDTIDLGNPCPSCLPAINMHVDTVTADGGTISWSPMGSNTDWAVYLDGEEVATGAVSDTTYSFTGLVANTTYTIGVRALCDDSDTSVMRTIQMRTACDGGNCEFTLEMTDSYGDGWNGNAIEVFQNGTLFGSYTIASGNSNTATVSPCLGDSVVLLWVTGNYPYEASFTVKDATDSVLLSSGVMTGHSTGDSIMVFDGLCNATVIMSQGTTPGGDCTAPTNLNATATDSTVTLTFTGAGASVDGYEVEIVEGTWAGSMGEEESTIATTYTFTGLTPGTDYTVAVRTVCDEYEYEYSDWVTFSITTTETAQVECYAPTALSTVNVDSNRATITWTAGGEETQWQIKVNNNDANLIMANTSTYTLNNLTPATEYRVRVRAYCSESNQSGWSAELAFTTDSVHGGEGIALADGMNVSLYPNPATSLVTVEATAGAEVSIIDLNGREMLRATVDGERLNLNVSGLARGAYFVRITSTEGTAVRKLIVK